MLNAEWPNEIAGAIRRCRFLFRFAVPAIVGGGSALGRWHHGASDVMRALISAGLLSLLVSSLPSIANDAPASDSAIQQRMVGTWFLDYYHAFQSTITIGTNGDYVAYRTNGHSRTNKLEGTMEIRDGLIIDTLKKSSITNEPVPLVFTNVIIRVTDRELVYRAQDRSEQVVFKKVTQ
jgi:hypothetical protein